MTTIEILIIVLGIILIIIGSIVILYIGFVFRKMSKTLDKTQYLLDDWIHKSELLNPPIESLKKLLNYVDGFDLIVKNNLKSGLSLIRRNNFLVYKLISNLKKIVIDSDDGFKTDVEKKK